MKPLFFAVALLICPLAAVIGVTPSTVSTHPEAKLYDAARDARADVDAALFQALRENKRIILVMGANWCHDSKSLAGRFETPRFKAMMEPKYVITYIDVGKPQIGEGRNLDIAKRFGIKKIKGTPTVLILSSEGMLLNKKDAPSWRNAASRSDDAIFAYFEGFGR